MALDALIKRINKAIKRNINSPVEPARDRFAIVSRSFLATCSKRKEVRWDTRPGSRLPTVGESFHESLSRRKFDRAPSIARRGAATPPFWPRRSRFYQQRSRVTSFCSRRLWIFASAISYFLFLSPSLSGSLSVFSPTYLAN